ncbi:MAG TPA: hypothetical protein VGH28_06295 [Polyangiaceae bacterium]
MTLRFLEHRPQKASLLHVSSGAPSHFGGGALTLTRAARGMASVVVSDGTGQRTVALRKGDSLRISGRELPVVDVVDGVRGGAIGWVTLDTSD